MLQHIHLEIGKGVAPQAVDDGLDHFQVLDDFFCATHKNALPYDDLRLRITRRVDRVHFRANFFLRHLRRAVGIVTVFCCIGFCCQAAAYGFSESPLCELLRTPFPAFHREASYKSYPVDH